MSEQQASSGAGQRKAERLFLEMRAIAERHYPELAKGDRTSLDAEIIQLLTNALTEPSSPAALPAIEQLLAEQRPLTEKEQAALRKVYAKLYRPVAAPPAALEGLREMIERKRAYYGKFITEPGFGDTNKIIAGHVLEFCRELDAALAQLSALGTRERFAGWVEGMRNAISIANAYKKQEYGPHGTEWMHCEEVEAVRIEIQEELDAALEREPLSAEVPAPGTQEPPLSEELEELCPKCGSILRHEKKHDYFCVECQELWVKFSHRQFAKDALRIRKARLARLAAAPKRAATPEEPK